MPADQPSSPGDELLRWVSESGAGSWDRLRDACAYVAEKYRLRQRPWTLASQLSALGHLDIDWETRRWSVAPPALNLVPGLGLCAVLTGSRPHYLDHRFDAAADDQEVYPFDVSQGSLPAARFAKCASVEAAFVVADRLGAEFVVDPARQMVDVMTPVDETEVSLAPEPSLEDARRFDPISLGWEDEHRRRPGLYRIDLHGRPVHRRLDEDGAWWAIDLPSGQFQELRGRPEPVVRWRSPQGACPSAFEVRTEVSLPTLVERAATVSSGFGAEVVSGWRSYRNVPRPLAESIARMLLQQLGST